MLPSIRIINGLMRLGLTREEAIDLLVEFIFEQRSYEAEIKKQDCIFCSK